MESRLTSARDTISPLSWPREHTGAARPPRRHAALHPWGRKALLCSVDLSVNTYLPSASDVQVPAKRRKEEASSSSVP